MRWDSSSAQYDMGFRNYAPSLNQFLTRDMYNGALADMALDTDPFTGNRYTFAAGNPVSNIALTGHKFCTPGSTDPNCDAYRGAPAPSATQNNDNLPSWCLPNPAADYCVLEQAYTIEHTYYTYVRKAHVERICVWGFTLVPGRGFTLTQICGQRVVETTVAIRHSVKATFVH